MFQHLTSLLTVVSLHTTIVSSIHRQALLSVGFENLNHSMLTEMCHINSHIMASEWTLCLILSCPYSRFFAIDLYIAYNNLIWSSIVFSLILFYDFACLCTVTVLCERTLHIPVIKLDSCLLSPVITAVCRSYKQVPYNHIYNSHNQPFNVL